jgi:hypothetical protein
LHAMHHRILHPKVLKTHFALELRGIRRNKQIPSAQPGILELHPRGSCWNCPGGRGEGKRQAFQSIQT